MATNDDCLDDPAEFEIEEEQAQSEEAPDDPEELDEDGEAKSRLESLIPGLVKRAISQGVEALSDDKVRETVVAEVVRKAIVKGGEVVDVTEDSVRRLMGEIPVAKDAADRIASRFDDYRSELFRILGDEMHDFFDRVDLGHEIQKALTSLSLEINTEIRFIPNDKAPPGRQQVKTEVTTRTKVRQADAEPEAPKKPKTARKKSSKKPKKATKGDSSS